MESARKLRWFDKGDTTAIVKTHLREKREMAETLGALKKVVCVCARALCKAETLGALKKKGIGCLGLHVPVLLEGHGTSKLHFQGASHAAPKAPVINY
eukprot:1159384-Pelagomonas_calceolata.AAC.4